MADVCEVVSRLQKTLQRSDLILSQVTDARDSAITKLTLMVHRPLPGGQEEAVEEDSSGQVAEHADPTTKRRVTNTLVTFQRGFEAVRGEVVQSTVNFLQERLNLEQEVVIGKMTEMLQAKTAEEFILTGKTLVEDLFPE